MGANLQARVSVGTAPQGRILRRPRRFIPRVAMVSPMFKDRTLMTSDERRVLRQDCDVYDDGHLRVEHDNYYVTCGGRRVPLALKEFLILSRLARNPDRVVTQADLWEHAWGREPVNGAALRVHVSHLRQKLAPHGLVVESMINVGYRLVTLARPATPSPDDPIL